MSSMIRSKLSPCLTVSCVFLSSLFSGRIALDSRLFSLFCSVGAPRVALDCRLFYLFCSVGAPRIALDCKLFSVLLLSKLSLTTSAASFNLGTKICLFIWWVL